MILQTQDILHQIRHIAVFINDKNDFRRRCWPVAGKNIVGGGVKRGCLRHLVEGVGSHHRGHGTSAHARFHPIHCLIGTDLDVVLRGVCLENLRGDIVVVFDGVDVGVDIPAVSIEEGLQRSQVIRLRIANIVCKSPQFGDANFSVAWLLTASGFDLCG